MTEYAILGAVQGGLWWPYGVSAQKPVSYSFVRSDQPRPFVNSAETLREAVESLMTKEGGDFSDAPRLTSDTLLLVTRHGATHETSRWFPLSLFPSVADYLTDELDRTANWEVAP